MTKRRTIIAAFLLIAVLVMGIGYAQLTDELRIQGSAGINAFDADVKFTNVTEVKADEADPTKFTTLSFNDDNGTMEVAADAIKVVGDKAVAKFTICNTAGYEVLVAAKVTKDDTHYFSVTTDWDEATKTIAAGSTIDITVTVEAANMPTANDVATSFTITIKAVGNPEGDATITW